MAHHHHRHCPLRPSQTSCCCCCSCQSPPCLQPPSHPQPPPDPLFQALISQLLQNLQITNLYSQYKTPITTTPLSSYRHHHQHQPQLPKQKRCSPNPEEQDQQCQTHSMFLSLLQRVNNLESSLHRFSFSSSCSFSLRDIAARTIQTHFRAYLVRRSRALRQLKELASIKSSLNSLKSSLSLQTYLDVDSLSRKATDLLLQVDAIQGGDQMIRDSKKSITQEIVRFLDLVDGVCVGRHTYVTKTAKSTRFATNDYRTGDQRSARDSRKFCQNDVSLRRHGLDVDQKKLVENLRERVDQIRRYSRVLEDNDESLEFEGLTHQGDHDGIVGGEGNGNHKRKNGILVRHERLRPNVENHVCFAEDGNLTRVYRIDEEEKVKSTNGNFDECLTKGDQDDEEADTDSEKSSQGSDGGRNLERDLRSRSGDEISENHQSQNGKLAFSAPLPVKMESRGDLMNKKQGLKIAG